MNSWLPQATSLVMFVLFAAPLAALLTEIFPVNVRSTGASLVDNFGVAIFGGFAPYICAKLVETTGDRLSPFYYLAGCIVLSLIGLAIQPAHAVVAGERLATA